MKQGILIPRNYFFFLASNSDVQCGHLVAAKGISEQQYGHFFVVGAAAFSSFFSLASNLACKVFMALISINTAKATIRKLIIVFKNKP